MASCTTGSIEVAKITDLLVTTRNELSCCYLAINTLYYTQYFTIVTSAAAIAHGCCSDHDVYILHSTLWLFGKQETTLDTHIPF